MSKLQLAMDKLKSHITNHTSLPATIQDNEQGEKYPIQLTPVDLVSLLDSARIKVASQTYKFLALREDYYNLNLSPNRGYIIIIQGMKFLTNLGTKGTLVDNDVAAGTVVISATYLGPAES